MCRPGRVRLHVALLRPAAERSDLTDLGSAARQQSQVSSPPVFIKPVFLFSFSLSLGFFLSVCFSLLLLFLLLSLCLSVLYLLLSVSVSLSLSLFVFLSLCLSVHLSVLLTLCDLSLFLSSIRFQFTVLYRHDCLHSISPKH